MAAEKWPEKWLLGLTLFFLLTSLAWASSRILEVEETDFVRLRAQGSDPDNDQISYTYSPPLNEKGEWQTNYGDAGKYKLEIKASDGERETVEEALLIVRNRNQPPRLAETRIIVKETQTVDLKLLVEDPDDDPLRFVFNEPFDQSGRWVTGWNDAGIYLADFTASDGQFTEEFHAGIEVANTIKPMTILALFAEPSAGSSPGIAPSLEIAEGETLAYWVEAAAGEGGGEIQYRWELDSLLINQEPAGESYFDYEQAGGHSLKLTLSQDGQEIVREWNPRVVNTNRAPELSFLPITVKEGEKIVLRLPEKDSDGDPLTYSVEEPFEDSQWQTDYFDAGTYSVKITADDGELAGEGILNITILNVDHPPLLNLPPAVELWEGQEFKLPVETEDPDQDELKITFKNLPEGSSFDEESRILTLKLSYETIKRSENWFSDIFNALRLEKLLPGKRVIQSEVSSCGLELCSSAKIKLVVNNVNRAPVFETPAPESSGGEAGGNVSRNASSKAGGKATLPAIPSALETEEFSLSLKAVDPDGDILNYYYSSPLGRTSGKWQTDYGDAGTYQVNVTATDGKEKTIIPISFNILKNNRAPSLKIKKDKFTVNEGEEFSFEVKATDSDGDEPSAGLETSLPGVSFKEGLFTWQPGFGTVGNRTRGGWNDLISLSPALNRRFGQDRETVWLNFVADDGEIKTEHPVKVTVRNVNQKPEMIDYLPSPEIKVGIGEPVLFHLAVRDPDKDKLEYDWSFGFGQAKVKGVDTIKRVFRTPGKKKVKVKITDGLEEVEHQWLVEVEEKEEIPGPAAGFTALEPAKFKVYVIRN